ncbi:hypothetical protein [Tannockella kyphosi]|uniref:hypothetical protein n=1 Tax=Tannockella kyphosi TaxID=2899121 RepID=UPI002013963F|nr:hypothetical protein [Tannockella kyphosi]
MNVYNKQDLQNIKVEGKYYLPENVFGGHRYPTVRVEVKLAYGALLNVLLTQPNYSQNGDAYVMMDNPVVAATLAVLANKAVDIEKMKGYYKELEELKFISIEKLNIYLNKEI